MGQNDTIRSEEAFEIFEHMLDDFAELLGSSEKALEIAGSVLDQYEPKTEIEIERQRETERAREIESEHKPFRGDS